jgi:hypothetical protein
VFLRRYRQLCLAVLILLPSTPALAHGADLADEKTGEPTAAPEGGPAREAAAPALVTLAPPGASLDRGLELARSPTPAERTPAIPGPAGETVGPPAWWSAGR